MLCSVNEASFYGIKKKQTGSKCTVQSAEIFAVHKVHKYVNG